MSEEVEVRLDNPANGGTSVGRCEDGPDAGLVVFARSGLPGELVNVRVDKRQKRLLRGDVTAILEASPLRQEPECQSRTLGCGGCDLAHARPELQLAIKQQVVRDAFERIAKHESPAELPVIEVPNRGYRTTVRVAVENGTAGHRHRASNKPAPCPECLVAHPGVEELLVDGRWGDASEVTIRVSEHSGERVALVRGNPTTVALPADVRCAGLDGGLESDPLTIDEVAAERHWQISARSFFQSGPSVVTALVEQAQEMLSGLGGVLLDAYSGIGIFAGTVGTTYESVIAVESAASSVADSAVNLAGRSAATTVHQRFERWDPVPVDVAIADPARSGLGKAGVQQIAATGAGTLLLVSCDPGSMGRDVGLLVERGFGVSEVRIVDAFPDTSHFETLVLLNR